MCNLISHYLELTDKKHIFFQIFLYFLVFNAKFMFKKIILKKALFTGYNLKFEMNIVITNQYIPVYLISFICIEIVIPKATMLIGR